tara:strand:+ start:42 stop:623 length:582 start_codon:yes stop_codon:yes gene_type:complete
MIQLYLLVLIIIFIVILFTIKEKFNGDSCNLTNLDNTAKSSSWTSDSNSPPVYLYGSTYVNTTTTPNTIGIKLTWNKSDDAGRIILIINTEDNDDTLIKDISKDVDIPKTVDDNPDKIKTYNLNESIIQNKTYFITLNYINTNDNDNDNDDVMSVSNTLKITATNPVVSGEQSGSSHQNLMNLLQDKTFDIYL